MSPRCTVTLALAALFSVAVSSARAGDDAVRMPPSPSSVLVVNPPTDPVKTTVLGTANVTGSVTLEGTPSVSATITNTPAVTLAGTPTVAVAPKLTVTALQQLVVVPAGGESQFFVDVSQYEEVRVALMVNDPSNQMTVFVHSGPITIDGVEMNGHLFATRNYRVPGTLLGVNLYNGAGSEELEVRLAVHGRE